MSPSSPDFNPNSYDSIFSAILTRLDASAKAFDDKCAADAKAFKELGECFNGGQISMDTRVTKMETWKDKVEGSWKFVLGTSVVLGGVVPLLSWLIPLLRK